MTTFRDIFWFPISFTSSNSHACDVSRHRSQSQDNLYLSWIQFMSLEDFVSALQEFQLAAPQPAPQLTSVLSTHSLTSEMSSTANNSQSPDLYRPIIQWPKWSGNPSDFPAFLISLEGAAEEYPNDRSFCYSVFSQSLPAEGQRRVAPWMRAQKRADKWSRDEFISHLEDLFNDRDATTRAQTKTNTLRQGPRQTFSTFRSIFEQLCSEADHLAPTGASKLNAMKYALASHLRQGIA